MAGPVRIRGNSYRADSHTYFPAHSPPACQYYRIRRMARCNMAGFQFHVRHFPRILYRSACAGYSGRLPVVAAGQDLGAAHSSCPCDHYSNMVKQSYQYSSFICVALTDRPYKRYRRRAGTCRCRCDVPARRSHCICTAYCQRWFCSCNPAFAEPHHCAHSCCCTERCCRICRPRCMDIRNCPFRASWFYRDSRSEFRRPGRGRRSRRRSPWRYAWRSPEWKHRQQFTESSTGRCRQWPRDEPE